MTRGRLVSTAVDSECFAQLVEFVGAAREWVCVTMYQFTVDGSPELVGALNRAGARGVAVYVVVNNWRLQSSSNRCCAELARALQPRVRLALWRHHVMNNTHCKFALRDDGRFVVLTSNVTAHFVAPCGWRGVGVEIEGDAVAAGAVWDAFAWLWRSATPQQCTGIDPPPVAGAIGGRLSGPRPAAIEAVQVLFEHTCAGCVADRVGGATARALLKMLASARTTVDVVASNLSSHRVIRALLEASRRGVRVRCVLSHGINTFYRWLGHQTNERVARRYSRELRIRWANGRGGETCQLPGCVQGSATHGVNHSKLVVVDDQHVIVGSSNLDWISLVHSAELNVAFVDPSGQMARVFARFWDEALD